MDEKDDETIRIASCLAKALKKPEIPGLPPKGTEYKLIQERILYVLPEPGTIMIDEIPKVFYLNSIAPSQYTVSFWAKVFSMEPQVFRSMINYFAFPMPDAEHSHTERLLTFIDVEEDMNINKLEEIATKPYKKYLELEAGKALITYKPQIDTGIDEIIKTDKIMEDVDKELKDLDDLAKAKDHTHSLLKGPRQKIKF